MINYYEEQSLIIYLVIIIYIGVRRLMPRKFRKGRMYFWSIIYVLLLIFFSAEVNDPLILLSLLPLGVWASLNFHEFLSNSQPLGFDRVTGKPVTPPPL
ncbi:MAG: hypothetical protein RXQ76_05880 [Acidianus sp.]